MSSASDARRPRVPGCAGTRLALPSRMREGTVTARGERGLGSHRVLPRCGGVLAVVIGMFSAACSDDPGRRGAYETELPRSPVEEDAAVPALRADAAAASDSQVVSSATDCALRGQQCFGRACCAGAGSCSEVPYENATTWTCGGVVAGGSNAPCGSLSSSPGCTWTTLSGCRSYGKIQNFCAPGTSVQELKRCDGSCFVPDALYQQYEIESCETAPKPGVPTCGGTGASWDAVLCCAK